MTTFFRDPRCDEVNMIPLGIRVEREDEEELYTVDQIRNGTRPSYRMKIHVAVYSKSTGRVNELLFNGYPVPREGGFGNEYGHFCDRYPTSRELAIIREMTGANNVP